MSTTLNLKTLALQDAFDLAILIEKEAQERYQEFADQFGTLYEGDAGTFFETMVANEQKHGEQLKKKRTQLFGNAPTRVNASMIWDVEAPAPGAPRPYLSLSQALQIALDAENKAKDFFEKALKEVTHPDVKALFKELAEEEVEHAKMVLSLMEKVTKNSGPDRDDDEIDEAQGID